MPKRGRDLAVDDLPTPHPQEDPAVAGLPTHWGARGTRTPDLLGAIQALSQLSYSPKAGAQAGLA